ncbi:MAG: 30S ribosomal protein S1 [Anaerolineae bacterium]
MDSYSLDSLAQFLQHAHGRYSPGTGAPDRFDEQAAVDPPLAEHSVERKRLWERLSRLRDSGQTVTGTVTGWNRGGLLVRWDDLQGFVPASQLGDVPLFLGDSRRDEILSRWVGKELTLKVIELDQSRNRLVFSERAAAWGPRQGDELLAQLSVGDVREGTISNVCDFGAFVDLGGVDGLVHISEISWGRVTHPCTLLHLGELVRVLVLAIDRENRHVGLSIKRLQQNPWALVDARYRIGDIAEAQVTNLVDFGAFVQLEQGLEGLVHISELSEEHVSHPSEVLEVGQHVMVRVLRVEKEQHRMSLSIKRVATEVEGAAHDIGDDASTFVD